MVKTVTLVRTNDLMVKGIQRPLNVNEFKGLRTLCEMLKR